MIKSLKNNINNNKITIKIDNKAKEIKENDFADEKEQKSYKKQSHKKSLILFDVLNKNNGASLQELQDITGWQKRSVRGVLSNLQKELRFTLVSINVSRPNENITFEKTTRYYIKQANFNLIDEPILNL